MLSWSTKTSSHQPPAANSSPPPAMAAGGTSRLRIYGPVNLGVGDDELSADQELPRGIGKQLLAKIRRCYGRVKPPLKSESVFDAGFCFGLLDPVSNIVAGVAISESVAVLIPSKGDEPGLAREPDLMLLMYERSCDGLVAVLVALFPYLTHYRAMWYLNMADADPLIAARLVIKHRVLEGTFGFASDATVAAIETALRCAAAAAQHPNPRQFALGWKLLSHSLHDATSHDPLQLINIMPYLLQQRPPLDPVVLSLEKSWELASRRLLNLNLSLREMNPVPQSTIRRMLKLASGRLLKLSPPEMPPLPRPTMRRMLLTTIHGYYLQALAWLPKDKLCSHYHHSLLHAGHCYGPLDPVSNIILNTLWYTQAYPLTPEKKVEIEAISPKALLRIAVRSLYGLISFLCTRYPAITPDEAMRRLQAAGADLQKADDPSFPASNRDDGAIMVSVKEAYVAAAKAAHHPKPHQQAEFLGPSNPVLSAFSQVLPLKDSGKMHELFVCHFRTKVARSKPAGETKNIVVLGPWDYSHAMRMIDDFWNQHNRAVRMVRSAIDMYSEQHGVPNQYELHIICGVNEFVDGPMHVKPSEYRCSHINFLATQAAGMPQKLFFAECCNDGSGVGLCCPVAMPLAGTEQVRCLYCEVTGSRIVHPAAKEESFRGRDMEFEKMLGGEDVHSEGRTNYGIICGCDHETLWVDALEEDHVYGDYICDNNKVEEKFPRDDMAAQCMTHPGSNR